jgi:hypothetical protein
VSTEGSDHVAAESNDLHRDVLPGPAERQAGVETSDTAIAEDVVPVSTPSVQLLAESESDQDGRAPADTYVLHEAGSAGSTQDSIMLEIAVSKAPCTLIVQTLTLLRRLFLLVCMKSRYKARRETI